MNSQQVTDREFSLGADVITAAEAMAMAQALSGPQRSMLLNLANGRHPNYGLYGRSAHGGAAGTLVSLQRKGFVDGALQLTFKGRVVAASIGIRT